MSLGPDSQQRDPLQRPLKHDDTNGNQKSECHGVLEHSHGFGFVAAAVGLCRETRSAHAQEAEIPVNEVEHHCPHRHRTDKRGTAAARQVSSDSRVEQPQQRNRDIRNDSRNGNMEYFAVHSRAEI